MPTDVEEPIVCEILSAKYFSNLMNEQTSPIKQSDWFNVVYEHEEDFKEEFLPLISLQINTTSEAIFKALDDHIQSRSL